MELIETDKYFELVSDRDMLIRKWESCGVRFNFIEHDHHIYLKLLVVPKQLRKQGIGTQILSELTEFANGKLITCIPVMGYGASSKRRLNKFYKDRGIYF